METGTSYTDDAECSLTENVGDARDRFWEPPPLAAAANVAEW
jgi:hypothetical protein